MRILFLGGAGMMATGSIRDLLSPLSEGVTSIVATDSSPERLAQLPSDPRLTTQLLDVSDFDAVVQAARQADLVVNGVPTFAGHQMRLFEAALEAGTTYVDYGGMGVYTVQQKAWHERFRQRKVMAVIGLGADPGLSNVLCRAVADRLESIEKINLYWTATKLGPPSDVLIPPYSLSTLLAEYHHSSQQFLDGQLREVGPRQGVETLQLPEPFGSTTFMFSQHSEPLTVPFAAGIAEKGIREFTWRLALPEQDHRAWTALISAGFGDFDEAIEVKGVSVKPLDVLEALLKRQRSRVPQPVFESHELHFAIGQGICQGKRTRVEARVRGGPDPLYDGYLDAGTSMNMSIGIGQIARLGKRPGCWAPEEYFEPTAYLAEVSRRRFQVTLETQTWEDF